LKYILQKEENDVNITNNRSNIANATYHDFNSFPKYRDNNTGSLNILCMNIESLPAKIDKLQTTITDLTDKKFLFHVICLQECWIKKKKGKDIKSLNLLKLKNYKMFFKGSNIGKNGGLITYIHDSIKSSKKTNFFDDSPSETWEGLTIEIENEAMLKPTMIHNVYRPPRNEKHRDFIDEFKTYANQIKCHKTDSILCGDLNYDLTTVNSDAKCKEYLSVMLGNKMDPKITLPTKFINVHAN
jgi:exonuclease III